MDISKDRLKQIIKEELGYAYHRDSAEQEGEGTLDVKLEDLIRSLASIKEIIAAEGIGEADEWIHDKIAIMNALSRAIFDSYDNPQRVTEAKKSKK